MFRMSNVNLYSALS